MPAAITITLEPVGPFSLRAAAGFGFGPTAGSSPHPVGAMRLAFPVDGGRGYAGVLARQAQEDGPVVLQLHGGAPSQVVSAQVARILSLDHDGEAFLKVGRRDPVIGRLQRAHPGQRPVLFHSPYEAAAWSIISARQRSTQAAGVRRSLAQTLGESFDLDGDRVDAFPTPGRLRDVQALSGLSEEKALRLRELADVALTGALEAETLRALGPEGALARAQQLRGIGPFYAGLVVLRATGFADAMLSTEEPRVLAQAARFYQLPTPPTLARFAELAERWRPFRTWSTVLLRLAGERGTA